MVDFNAVLILRYRKKYSKFSININYFRIGNLSEKLTKKFVHKTSTTYKYI